MDQVALKRLNQKNKKLESREQQLGAKRQGAYQTDLIFGGKPMKFRRNSNKGDIKFSKKLKEE